ncbi:TRAP transporter large permease subunit [Sinorhizobium medicae]|nr:TRAP transporter large permease subunit [Sinorhizobium medicae]MDX0911057.1 TRAP transporter large permease subunit [Sinorhizobium medicae]MDX0992124.1 TRAP transporter large permease subunit [Sinorhizobium medicae]MDX1078255.1 TRAP transporter large permease subunit [Sinorhizobium medicae]
MTTTTEGVSEFAVLAETMEARPGSRLMRPVEALSAVLLLAIIAMLLSGVVFRYGLSRPIVWIDEAASIAFLWLAMLGSAIAIDRCEHLRLTIFLNALGERARQFTETLGMVAIMAFLLVLLPAAYMYASGEMDITSSALNIPAGYRAAAIAVGMVLMVLLAVAQLLRTARALDVAVAVAAVAAVASALWLLSPALTSFGNGNILIFLVGGAAVCLAMGVPIAFCFGIATLLFLAFTTSMPLVVMIGRMDEGMSSLILLSVPVFVLLGCILDATGMGKAIVDFLASMLGHVKAGMSYVLLGSLFLVSGISGSKVSDMATVAPALFPEMKRRGHKPKEMIALLATGAAMADTVPPSIVLIVLGSVAGVSIAALFTSGFAIALVLLVALAALARIKAARENVDGVIRPSLKRIGFTALIAAPALVLPFIIRSAVASGAATATEVSTIAVVYAFIIGTVLYGGIGIRRTYKMLVETAAMSGAILLILGTAAAMAWALTQTGFAFELTDMMSGLPGGWFTFMLVSIALFMLLGCVLEGLPAIVLLAPIMFPIARAMGIHDVHYSMVIVTAMNVGLMAPPIGIGFYIACKIGNVSPDEAMGAIWPYIGAMVLGLLLIAAVPWFSLALL